MKSQKQAETATGKAYDRLRTGLCSGKVRCELINLITAEQSGRFVTVQIAAEQSEVGSWQSQ